MNGLYKIVDIAAHIKKGADVKVLVFVLENGICIMDSHKLHDDDGFYNTDVYLRLRLVCSQLDEKQRYLPYFLQRSNLWKYVYVRF